MGIPLGPYTQIGAFEAKTRLSEILRKVGEGERFTITHRGRPVADIVPSQMKDRRRAAEAVRRLLAMPKIEGVSPETVKEWIEEGRK
jgi:prevent-host-death family protein